MTLDALLQDQAALLALGSLGPDAMRATIDRALDEGVHPGDFIDTVHPGPDPQSDQPSKAFRALLAARAIVVPDRRQAMWRVIAWHMRRIADERTDARVELAALIDAIYFEPELDEIVTKYVGDAFGIEQLIGNHWAFDDLEAQPDTISCGGFYGVAAIDHMKHLIRIEAIRWLRVHGA